MLVSEIQRRVCAHYGLPAMAMTGKTRWRDHARPRQIAMYIARRLTSQSLPQIAHTFHRDHTTVLYACRQVAKLRKADPVIDAHVSHLLRELGE